MIIALLVLILFAVLFPGILRMIVIGLLLIVGWAWVSVTHADAATMPMVDVDAVCARRGELIAVNQCVVMEQNAYDDLQFLWPALNPDRQKASIEYFRSTAVTQPVPLTYLRAFVTEQLNEQQVEQLTTGRQHFKP